jgi:hypothetical protein
MKTPIQNLIENLTEQLDKVVKEHPIEVDNDTYWRGVKIGLETAIEVTESMIEKEKDMIENVYVVGYSDGDNDFYFNDDYYNKTFNTKNK